MSEFNLINRYFKSLTSPRNDVLMGIGDDCAVTQVPVGCSLAVSTDTLIAGVHFPFTTSAQDIGFKALAVNLSDLAAMGAQPAWVSLAITLPELNDIWLSAFVEGFSQLADQYNVQLIGGDTTRGELSITVQVFGFLQQNNYLARDQAKAGDLLYVSGQLGDAGLGLQCALNKLDAASGQGLSSCVQKLNRPMPRVELGLALQGVSRCAIDISDGLIADLQHILDASHCGAIIELERIPLSASLRSFYKESIDWNQVLTSGDDYELCFTVPLSQQNEISVMAKRLDIELTCIGKITSSPELQLMGADGHTVALDQSGYNHFS